MFIRKLEVKNFKSFQHDTPPMDFNVPNGKVGSGLNIFVGENNTGKSTIFEAIDFLRNGTKKSISDIKNKGNQQGEVSVDLTFEGAVENVIDNFSQPNKVNIFKKYIIEHEGAQLIRFLRKTPDAKAIKLWSNDDQEYKNESGIDAPVKKIFEANFVWADTNPNDQASFGATTICGNLLKEIAKSFTETEDYKGFSDKFHTTFNTEDSGLRKELKVIEEKTQAVFREQFGNAGISFHFNELDINTFFKNTTIELDDGVNTSMEEKGSGMQRSVALALLQVYAEELTKHPEKDDAKKPFFLFVDEPEICLHPKAQEKLLHALLELSKTKQIFLTTHSPYFLSTSFLQNVGLFIFTQSDSGSSVIERVTEESKLFPWSPTWGEINYKAYNLPTLDFHNELYGYLQEKSEKWSIPQFDTWLVSNSIQKTKTWTMEQNGTVHQPSDVTLQTFIRNKMHHPENTTMQAFEYTQEDLLKSTQEMVAVVQQTNSEETQS